MNAISTPASAPPTRKQARRAAILWTSIILGLLLTQIGLCAWGVYCATKGKPVAVEEDYYNKAVHWDDTHKASK
jgi:hypothetical protein